MDTHKFGKGTSWEHRKLLKKNSVISVTIDDLREGLVVVSFSHDDKMYQGVLLQLNRERGIPCGISFPKDYLTESETPPIQVGGVENDPTQIAALPQRHTYFQEATTTTVTSSLSSADTTGLRSRVGLRRFIKPPARFKNSRMSLRLRNRPVLCAKCRAFCEEKGGLKPIEKKKKEEPEVSSTSKKVLGPAGVTTRNRGKSGVESTSTAATDSTATTSLIPTGTATTTTTTVDSEPSQDYSYVSFPSGSCQDLIENYWKRPSLLPEPDKPKKPDKPNGEAMLFAKIPKLNLSHINGKDSSSNTSTKEYLDKKIPKSLLMISSSGIDKTVKIKKSKNFKAGVNKVAKPSSSSQNTVDLSPPELNSVDGSIDKNHDNTTDPSRLPEVALGSDLLSSTKMWENRIRKKSCVPVRFRDESYSKKVFGFKRRRKAEDEYIEESEGSELNGRILPCDELDEISKNKTVSVDFNKLSPTEASSSSSDTSLSSTVSNLPTTSNNNTGGVGCSSSVSGNSNTGQINNSIVPVVPVPTKAKTPVIKISFGTSGNGVIVEIPRKVQEQDEPLSEKAARRAMKKAKKEARRKCSSSKDSTSPPPLKQASSNTFSSTSSSVPFNSHSQSPSPPTLNPINPEYPVFANCDEADSLVNDRNPPTIESMESLNKTPKKKKKDKKRKRHKSNPKENDGHPDDTLHQELLTSLQSSSSTSPPIKTILNHETSPSSRLQDMKANYVSSPPASMPLVSPSLTQDDQDSVKKLTIQDEDHSLTRGNHEHYDLLILDDKVFYDSVEGSESKPQEMDNSIGETPQRVCISLKRLCENSYVSLDQRQSSNNHELSTAVESEPAISPDSEINDYPMNDPMTNDHQEGHIHADSLSTYTDESNSFVYRKDDIIWGKLPACPWWPGKILDILCVDSNDVTARVSWFRASTLSRIRFSQLLPFTDNFEARYARSRKRGSYQLAVKDALIEAHSLDQNGANQIYPND